MIDRGSLIDAAIRLEALALELGAGQTEADVAIGALMRAADGNVHVLRRAHRHCEREVSEQWPAMVPLLRAFFFLSAARQRVEVQAG